MTTPNEADIDALKAEREGYVKRGLEARAKLVDAELARRGVKVRPERAKAVAATSRAADDNVETADATPASPVETASAAPRRRKK
jgi:hypothetical protein